MLLESDQRLDLIDNFRLSVLVSVQPSACCLLEKHSSHAREVIYYLYCTYLLSTNSFVWTRTIVHLYNHNSSIFLRCSRSHFRVWHRALILAARHCLNYALFWWNKAEKSFLRKSIAKLRCHFWKGVGIHAMRPETSTRLDGLHGVVTGSCTDHGEEPGQSGPPCLC
jgi:hypothetical protein